MHQRTCASILTPRNSVRVRGRGVHGGAICVYDCLCLRRVSPQRTARCVLDCFWCAIWLVNIHLRVCTSAAAPWSYIISILVPLVCSIFADNTLRSSAADSRPRRPVDPTQTFLRHSMLGHEAVFSGGFPSLPRISPLVDKI